MKKKLFSSAEASVLHLTDSSIEHFNNFRRNEVIIEVTYVSPDNTICRCFYTVRGAKQLALRLFDGTPFTIGDIIISSSIRLIIS